MQTPLRSLACCFAALLVAGVFCAGASAAPANDNFADASEIQSALPASVSADNALATVETGEPARFSDSPVMTVWFKWTPAQSGTVSIGLCGTTWTTPAGEPEIDSRLSVFTDPGNGGQLSALEETASSDDGCAAPHPLLSHIYLPVAAGATYWIRVGNFNAATGFPYTLDLRWLTTPEYIRAPYISPSDSRLGVGQTINVEKSEWAADPGIESYAYGWQRCDADGANCAPVDGADAASYEIQPGDIGHRFVATVTASNGEDSVTAATAPSGTVEDRPANDDFANAVDLGASAPVSRADDNAYATTETGEADISPFSVESTVWYRWTAPATTTYAIDTCPGADEPGSPLAMSLAVYSSGATTLAALTPDASAQGGCGDDTGRAAVYLAATAGSEYWIQAGGPETWNQGDFVLHISEAEAPALVVDPSIIGTAAVDEELTAYPGAWRSLTATTTSIAWSVCESDGVTCAAASAAGDSLVVTGAMAGKRLRATVTVSNAIGPTSASALSASIPELPVDHQPPVEPQTDPVPSISLPKSVGRLRAAKGRFTLAKLRAACGAGASGPCTGTLVISTARNGKVKAQKQTFRLSVAPGKSLPTTYKLSAKLLAAVKTAKKLQAKIAVELGAPGWPKKAARTTATLTK